MTDECSCGNASDCCGYQEFPPGSYQTIGFWRFIWHSIRHATHEITTVYDAYEIALYVCHECKVVTPAE